MFPSISLHIEFRKLKSRKISHNMFPSISPGKSLKGNLYAARVCRIFLGCYTLIPKNSLGYFYFCSPSILRVVARENVHISQYPTPKNETRAKRKTSNFWRQKSALERACFTWPWTQQLRIKGSYICH